MALNGHKRAVTALRYGSRGARLASGSRDTDVIVWDTVNEAGLYRLRGHRDEVTGACFVDPGAFGCARDGARDAAAAPAALAPPLLVTCAKDMLVKVWDLAQRTCVQTLVGHRSEVNPSASCHKEMVTKKHRAPPPLHHFFSTSFTSLWARLIMLWIHHNRAM